MTSVAREASGWVALAVLKREALQRDGAFTTAAGVAITNVTPFPDARPLGLPGQTPAS